MRFPQANQNLSLSLSLVSGITKPSQHNFPATCSPNFMI
jgi:hypothetical protein